MPGRSLVQVPDLLASDMRVDCAARARLAAQLRHLEDKENVAPNVDVATRADRSKRTRRIKQTAKASRPTSSKKKTARAVSPPPATGPARGSASPTAVRIHKQQKRSDGEAALLGRCTALGPDAAWSVSPPLGRVQERHIAFALRARATRSRGPSLLHTTTLLHTDPQGNQAPDIERLAHDVAGVEL